jgi:tRNA (guanine37-N1)-methyltransferase
MKFHVISIFPNSFSYLETTKIWSRGREKGLIEFHAYDLRDFSDDPHRKVDDTPYGGGPGMLLQVEPLVKALESIPKMTKSKVVLTSPQGEWFTQEKAQSYSELEQIILICGRYEGVDERFVEHWVDEVISIGDYVLLGGELPAMVMMEAVSRLIPGIVGDPASVQTDSLTSGGLKYPQYTRPAEFRGHKVPDVLLSGNHENIRIWREKKSHFRTLQNRPDLLKQPIQQSEKKK